MGIKEWQGLMALVSRVFPDSKATRNKWVVDCDLKSFFDTVNHDVMMNRLSRKISDPRVLSLIRSYLKAGIIHRDGRLEVSTKGMPFGMTRELDGWVRQRMRLYYWKQWGRPKTRRRNLLKLGVPKSKVHMASRSRKGHWRMSNTTIVRTALHNEWLEEQGVPSLVNIWKYYMRLPRLLVIGLLPEQPEILMERISKL